MIKILLISLVILILIYGPFYADVLYNILKRFKKERRDTKR